MELLRKASQGSNPGKTGMLSSGNQIINTKWEQMFEVDIATLEGRVGDTFAAQPSQSLPGQDNRNIVS